MSSILKKFPNENLEPDEIVKTESVYYHLKNGKKLLDTTSGWTGHASMGFCNPRIINAIKSQMEKFTHIDINVWKNPMLEKLAAKLLKYATNDLDKIYFSGTSGSDCVDAAMKLSYQVHYDNGNKTKTSYITRVQSFNGVTLHALSISDLPILKMYSGILPKNIFKVSQHNPFAECKFDLKEKSCECGKKPQECMGKFKNETDEEYVNRSIKEIEDVILKCGPENICAFVGETQLGSLVGDVPPAKDYWRKIGELAKKYDIHIILDEVYCGMGRSGKLYNYSWDDFSPDFVCLSKSMTSGCAPMSAILTKSKFEKIIAEGSGRINLGQTFQGFSLGAAGCMEYMNILEDDMLLNRIVEKGEYMRSILIDELESQDFFNNVRGRGYSFSLEHKTPNNPMFGINLQQKMRNDHNILINSKWHRTSFMPPFIMKDDQIDLFLEKFISTFKFLQKNWTSIEKNFDMNKVSKTLGGGSVKKN
jgi:adenosylmethionine-8-amino-7-oxononanoate aminotransferase